MLFFGVLPSTTDVVVADGLDVEREAGRHRHRPRRRSPRSPSSPARDAATGGVRAHTFLKGEDVLAVAWAGPAPALAVGTDGAARTLPDAGAKRDASGTPVDGVIGSIGSAL